MGAKEKRMAAGKSRAWCAAMAGVSEATARAYELDPSAVSESRRRRLAGVYDGLDELPHVKVGVTGRGVDPGDGRPAA
jgi:hypothetical protein